MSQTISRNMQGGREKQDPVVAELLSKIFDPRAWFSGTDGMDQALQKMAEGPRLADLWDTERKMLTLFNAWTALRRRSLEHNTVMLETRLQAAGKFAKDLNESQSARRHSAHGARFWGCGLRPQYRAARNCSVLTRISRVSARSSKRVPIYASRSRRWRPSIARCSAIRRAKNSMMYIAR